MKQVPHSSFFVAPLPRPSKPPKRKKLNYVICIHNKTPNILTPDFFVSKRNIGTRKSTVSLVVVAVVVVLVLVLSCWTRCTSRIRNRSRRTRTTSRANQSRRSTRTDAATTLTLVLATLGPVAGPVQVHAFLPLLPHFSSAANRNALHRSCFSAILEPEGFDSFDHGSVAQSVVLAPSRWL